MSPLREHVKAMIEGLEQAGGGKVYYAAVGQEFEQALIDQGIADREDFTTREDGIRVFDLSKVLEDKGDE